MQPMMPTPMTAMTMPMNASAMLASLMMNASEPSIVDDSSSAMEALMAAMQDAADSDDTDSAQGEDFVPPGEWHLYLSIEI